MGNFTQDLSGLAPFIKAAHDQGVKVLPSIAGGGRHDFYHKLLRDDMRGKFVNDLVEITEKYNFDGIDVDIEGSDIDTNYEAFGQILGDAPGDQSLLKLINDIGYAK